MLCEASGIGIWRRTETSSSSIPMNIDRPSIRTPRSRDRLCDPTKKKFDEA